VAGDVHGQEVTSGQPIILTGLSNDYDKILKENIATVFLPLTAKYLGIRIVRSEELKDKLQTTIEKETDFVRVVETDRGETFILHLEFQSVDEEGMVYRMQEYYGLLRRKYQLPVRQFVIYLGQKPSKMRSQLPPEEVFTGFTLQSLRDYDYQTLLASDVPEEIILAVLSNFKGRKPAEVLKGILRKLKEVSGEEITLRKYVRQLAVLARLRNLTQETQKQVTNMGLLYDITKDYLYQQGMEKGIEKGQQETKRQMIESMLKIETISLENIATVAGVPVEYVQQIAEELKK
jgi:predicted transposase YdaD